ncbi:hypothetical protein WA026_001662, partial [Henosepilachna vigintioctopunctata]
SKLVNILPENLYMEYSHRLNLLYGKRFNTAKNTNINKFLELKENSLRDAQLFSNNNKWFKNMSDINIPKDIADFSSLGPYFGVSSTINQFNAKNFLADIEDILQETPENEKNNLRSRSTNNITNYKSKLKST